jgi:hypothetical protein
VFRGSSRAVSTVPGPPGQKATVYPWAVNGQYVATVAGMPPSTVGRKPADGVAYAFRPGGAYIRLGPAMAVYGASQPGRFWIRRASFRGHTPAARPRHCTATEMSVTGQRITGPLAMPCTRWIIATVPGGFVSIPTAIPNMVRAQPVRTWDYGVGGGQIAPETPVQLWNPVNGKVVRTYRIDPGWIYGASDQYLAWQPPSVTPPPVSSVEITSLATGKTRQIALPVNAGDHTWRSPILAPRGPYLAWVELPRATWRKFAMEAPSGGGGAPGLPGPGRVKVLDFATGRVIMNRATTVAWAGAFDWSPDNRYLFVTTGYTTLNIVPTWSDAARIRTVHLPSHGDMPDTQQLLVTAAR